MAGNQLTINAVMYTQVPWGYPGMSQNSDERVSAADIRAANRTALGRTLDMSHGVLRRMLRIVGADGASTMAEAV